MSHCIKIKSYLFILTSITLANSPLQAADIYYTGTTILHRWSVNNAWSTNTVPTRVDRVTIDRNVSNILVPNSTVFEVGSVWLPEQFTLDGFSNESMGIMQIYGIDGIGALLENTKVVNFFRRVDLKNDIIIRANNIGGGGFSMSGLVITNLWQGIQLNEHTLRIDTVNDANRFLLGPSSSIRGTGNLIKSGSGSLSMASVSEFTGSTLIEAGKIILTGNGSLASSSGVQIEGPGTLDITQTTSGTEIKTLSGTGHILLGTKALELSNATGVFGGVISGDGTVDVTGGHAVFSGINTYTGPTSISPGAQLTLGDGGTSGTIGGDVINSGILAFNRSDSELSYNGAITGDGTIQQIGAGKTTLTGDNSTFAGTTNILSGTLAINNVLGGTLSVSGGRLQGIGTVGHATNLAGGTIAPGNSIGTITVDGDYIGDGGVLEIEAELGDDTSPTDLLIISGSTSGSSGVKLVNLGGTGAPTVEGIKIVDVGGTSGGLFSLLGDYSVDGQPAVVAGAYAYQLYQNGITDPTDGDWYLRSVLAPVTLVPETPAPTVPADVTGNPSVVQPIMPIAPRYQAGVPLYEAYSGALLSLNQLPRLHQRVGQRFRTNDASAPLEDDDAAWIRIFSTQTQFKPKASTSAAHYDLYRWTLQAGIDGLITDNDRGQLIGGINMHYSTASTEVFSRHGKGRIDTQTIGLSATVTWYGENGFYADTQAQASWYDSSMNSHTAGKKLAHENGALGTALSLEIGRQLELTSRISITPQTQLSYSAIHFDDFTDVFQSAVTGGHNKSLKARIGLSANHQTGKRTINGVDAITKVYGIANISREFLNERQVTVSNVNFTSQARKLSGEIGLGAKLELAGKLSLYGEISLETDFSRQQNSRQLNSSLGLKLSF